MLQMPAKQVVRVATLAARRAMTAAARGDADRALVAAAVELVSGLTTIGAYSPTLTEPGGPGLVDALAAVVDTVLLPVLRMDLDLDWTQHDGGVRHSDRIGAHLGVDAITDADVVLVPALAVDRTGVRLGRGGGSYDRALARVRAGTPVVALLYDTELYDRLACEPHDRPVTAALLPRGLRRL